MVGVGTGDTVGITDGGSPPQGVVTVPELTGLVAGDGGQIAVGVGRNEGGLR